MTDFDPEFDKIPDQPVTIGGDKSAAAWHGTHREMEVVRTREDLAHKYVEVSHLLSDARAERDALALQDNRVRHILASGYGDVHDALADLQAVVDTAPAFSLALHDAEVWDEGYKASISDHDSPRVGMTVNPYRAAAIREEAK